METKLVRESRLLAEQVFSAPEFAHLPFHNLNHTKDVVDAVKEIGMHSELTEEEMEACIAAAWLHDVGYRSGMKDHEKQSVAVATELFQRLGTPVGMISMVNNAILSTHMPQQPRSIVDKVLCDADLAHLAGPLCEPKSILLREELEGKGKSFGDDEWKAYNLTFMQQHHYHTPYGQTVLEEGKRKNIKRIKKSGIDKMEGEESEIISHKKYKKLREENEKLKGKLDKAKGTRPDRGIETMFRTTSHNHVMLSQMVDNKASILITINSIILSLVVSVLIRKLEQNPALVAPTVMLVSVCLATMVFSILASRPNVSSGKFTKEDIRNKKTNLLFFGNFHAMDFDDYYWGMNEMMKDAEYLYGSMIKDVYYLGKVLGKKYHYLRIAYSIFMYGFVVAILAFGVAFALTSNGQF
ncbi:Pycsar system effector family protein [Chryseolinea sp. T2]|uniref:Pycsar system effector family protein n=1 Tax=Chryseolinea sp. T2 TaxID=3129255 RepID=UPI003077623C